MLDLMQVIVAKVELDGMDTFPSFIKTRTLYFFAQLQFPNRQPVMEKHGGERAFALALLLTASRRPLQMSTAIGNHYAWLDWGTQVYQIVQAEAMMRSGNEKERGIWSSIISR